MSPQLREKLLGQAETYSAFKADVFSLGMTLYAMASLTSLDVPWLITSLEQTVQSKVGALPYSETLKALLIAMLSHRETDRPDMQTVLERVSIESAKYDLVRTAAQLKAAGDYQRALDLLQCVGSVSAEVCLELGQVYSHFGRWAEAEAVLAQGLSIQSNLTVQLNNVLAETHFQRRQYKQCIAACDQALATGQGPTFELQKALFYLAKSHYWLGDGLGGRLVDQWARVLVSDTPRTKCLPLLIIADRQRVEGNAKEAVSGYEAGLELAREQCPDSLFTAISSLHLAWLYVDTHRREKADQLYLQAKVLCQTHFPQSVQLAKCLNNLGLLYYNTHRFEQSEQFYLQAKALYQTHFPLSVPLANCLYNLGLLYKSQERKEEASEKMRESEGVYAHLGLQADVADCQRQLKTLSLDS